MSLICGDSRMLIRLRMGDTTCKKRKAFVGENPILLRLIVSYVDLGRRGCTALSDIICVTPPFRRRPKTDVDIILSIDNNSTATPRP